MASSVDPWSASSNRTIRRACADAEAAAGAPRREARPANELPPATHTVVQGTPVASGGGNHAPSGGLTLGHGTHPLNAQEIGSSQDPDAGKRAETLLQQLAEFTGLRNSSPCSILPVDFKITLQVVEYMGQQARLLQQVKNEVQCMREEMTEHMFFSKEESETREELRHDELRTMIRSGTNAVNGHITEHHEKLHEKMSLLHDKVHDHMNSVNGAAVGEGGEIGTTAPAVKQATAVKPFHRKRTSSTTEKTVDQEIPFSKLGEQGVTREEAIEGAMYAIAATSSPNDTSEEVFSKKLSRMEIVGESLSKIGLRERDEDNFLRRVIQSSKFEWVCAVVIMANAVTIGISAEDSIQWAFHNPGVPYTTKNAEIYIMNKIYITFYTMELITKFWVFRCDFFLGINCRWNIFDLILVTSGLYDLLTEFAPINLGSGVGVTWLRVLRIVKTLKLLRVIRVMRFFQVLRLMVSAIIGSMATLFWTILMISIMMYMFGLCFLNCVTLYLNDNKEIPPEHMEGIDLYWSSVPQSMMTLFWAVTGGADWEPLAAPIRNADWFFYSLFFFYIAFAAFAVLNVLTGMFVMQADEVAQADEENVAGELEKLKEVKGFRTHVLEMGGDRKGFVSSELIMGAHKGSPSEEGDSITSAFERALEITHADCQRVFSNMDPDDTGFVNLEEFIKGCCHANGSISGLDMVLLTNEAKHINKQLLMAVEFIEERFDEMLLAATEGAVESSVEPWSTRLNEAKRADAQSKSDMVAAAAAQL